MRAVAGLLGQSFRRKPTGVRNNPVDKGGLALERGRFHQITRNSFPAVLAKAKGTTHIAQLRLVAINGCTSGACTFGRFASTAAKGSVSTMLARQRLVRFW
jgi:hypothetical protein